MVIQRWQSVLLLVAAVMMGLASFLPLVQIQGPTETYTLTSFGLSSAAESLSDSTWIVFIVAVMGALLPLIDIFLYRNLKLQMRVALFSLMFSVALCVIIPIEAYQFAAGCQIDWLQMCCAPVLAVVAEVMAWQRINSDRRRITDSERFI